MDILKRQIEESFVINHLRKIINYDYSNSLISKILNVLFNKSASFLRKIIYKREGVKESINNSFFISLFKKITDYTWLINGLIIALCMNVPHHMWNNMYIVLGMFLITFIYFIRNVLFKDNQVDYKNVGIAFLMFTMATIIAAFISLDYSNSLRQFLFYLAGFLAYINVAGSIKTKKELIGFCYILFITIIMMSIYGLYQNHVGVPVNESYIDTELNQGMKGRVYGAVENPNNFAEVLLLLIPICGAVFLGVKKWKTKIIVAMLTLMPILVMLLTGTRSGWGALGLAAFIFCLLWDKRLIPVFLALVIAAFAVLPYASPAIYKRVKTIFVSNNDHSMSYRDTIMNATLPVLRDNIVSGIGIGSANFSRHIANNFDFETSAPPHSHNVFIQMWVEQGLLGFISFILILLGTWIYSMKEIFSINKLKKEDEEKYKEMLFIKYILIAIVAGSCGLALMGFLDYVLFYPRIMILFFIYIGFSKAAQKVSKTEREM